MHFLDTFLTRTIYFMCALLPWLSTPVHLGTPIWVTKETDTYISWKVETPNQIIRMTDFYEDSSLRMYKYCWFLAICPGRNKVVLWLCIMMCTIIPFQSLYSFLYLFILSYLFIFYFYLLSFYIFFIFYFYLGHTQNFYNTNISTYM